jgi:hypothetical protein
MQYTLTTAIRDADPKKTVAHHRSGRPLALLSIIIIATGILANAASAQNFEPVLLSAYQLSNPPVAAINIKDRAQSNIGDLAYTSQQPVAKIILSANPPEPKAFTINSINPQAPPAPNQQPVPQPVQRSAMSPRIPAIKASYAETKKNGSESTITPAPIPVPEPERLPQPPTIDGAAVEPGPATPPGTPLKADQKLGEAPPDTSMEFLRQQTVLLKPGERQLDIGISYLIYDNIFADLVLPSGMVQYRLRQRLLTMPVELRYGLCDRVQLFANAPLGWANSELSSLGSDEYENSGGIGDTNAGATFHIYESDGTSCSPDVLFSCGFTAPTGNADSLISIIETPGITLGQGFWAAYWNLLIVHKYDPVIVFYGFGSRHYFAKDIEPYTGVSPGDQFTYQLGTGFAINERITLSTMFFGSYITESRLNGERVPGTILEPLSLRFATTITRPNERIVEPFAEIGLTDDAANARFGITWTF